MKETVELKVSFDTTFEDIELLRLEMENFVRSPDNARDFQPDFNISVAGVGELDKMVLFITIKHKSNWHNDSVRAVRRSKFMCALAMALKKIPIYGPGGGSEELGGPTNPSYSVAVSNDFAAAARDEASKKKDESRMVPTSAEQTEEDARANEKHAITEINARHPFVETEGLYSPRDNEDRFGSPRDADDHRRSRDIESVRSELVKRASTRGRRRVGEGLQNIAPTESGYSGAAPQAVNSRLETFDEEAQTGVPSPHSGSQTGFQAAEEERLRLYQSASQRSQNSQHGRYQGPSYPYKDSRGLTPGRR